jgi:hypothetical protein
VAVELDTIVENSVHRQLLQASAALDTPNWIECIVVIGYLVQAFVALSIPNLVDFRFVLGYLRDLVRIIKVFMVATASAPEN